MLVVAPFERGRGHGGSQRATALAERLEERGGVVDWAVRPVTRGGPAEKASALLRGEAEVVRENTRPPLTLDGSWDVALAAHSYMAPHLDAVAARRVVDFHNVEWRVLDALGRRVGGARGAYKRLQARLMRRHEERVVRSGAACVFVSGEEHAWARAAGLAGEAVVAPNLLPRAAVEEARAIAAVRSCATGARFAYVGTLTFPPNVTSLLRWLEEVWPAVREALPDAELDVAGRSSPELRDAIARHPGVTPLGFVDDLAGVLAGAAAAVLPFEGEGGSSLRFLHFALARVPVVATGGAAERGLPFRPGLLARTPAEWAAALGACTRGEAHVEEAVDHAERAARALHDDPEPWDALWEIVAGGGGPR